MGKYGKSGPCYVDTTPPGGGSELRGHSEFIKKKQWNKQPQENHKTKMAVQETASQLSMALKVQEYPTLKVKQTRNRHMLIVEWFPYCQNVCFVYKIVNLP